MAVPSIDKSSRYENKQHGSSEFPFIIYAAHIPDYIYSYPVHWHDETELILVTKGRCIVTIDKVSHHLQEGDIALILPGMLHAIDHDNMQEAIYYNIVFDMRLLGDAERSDICYERNLKPYLDGRLSLPHILPASHPLAADVSWHLSELIHRCIQTSDGLELLIKAHLFAVFWLLKPLQSLGIQTSADHYQQTQIQKMKDLLRFVNAHYAKPIALKEAADFCGYSVSYFMKFFKSFTGETFVEYLNHYRLKKASELLTDTDRTILEISEATGFENHSYFIRLFKRYYGITPLQYRKKKGMH